MAEDNSNLNTPSWAEPHISNLAKIHDLFDSGSQKIRTFMKEHSVTSEDYEKFKIIPGVNKDNFRKMIESQDVKSYLKNLEEIVRLNTSMETACGRNRSIDVRFVKEVVNIADIEDPPKELFAIHDGIFPFERNELMDISRINRQIRNQAWHIRDVTSDVSPKAKRDWKKFLDLVLPLEFNGIMEMFVKGLQIIEFIEDGTRDIIDYEYVETQMRKYTDKSLTFSEPELIKRALGANKWDKYIEVEHKQDFEGEAEEAMAINQLDFLMREDSPNSVIEINGVGGLGKTKLSREYIVRSVDMNLRYRPKRYERYIYYTAKSENQGEIRATYGEQLKNSPRDWKHGGGDYIEGLVFQDFMEKMQKMFDLNSYDLEERIIETLKDRSIFILLDNFEDVSDDDIPLYKKFFNKIPKDFKSQIVITSRRERTYGGKSIELDRFSKAKAVEMLCARYEYEIRKNPGVVRTDRLNQLQEARDNQVDLIQEILNKVHPPENADLQFLMNKETLEKNLRHPLYLRYLANILANPTLIKKTDKKTSITEVIVYIIDDPEFKFWEWHENVINWMLEHAYTSIEKYSNCIDVLKILIHDENITSRADLYIAFQKKHPETRSPRKDIEEALKQIKSHREFFDEQIELKLTSSAKKFLRPLFTDGSESLGHSNSVKEGNESNHIVPKEPVDFGKLLKLVTTNGVKTPQDFVDAVYRLENYSKSESKDSKLVEKAENILSNYVVNLELREEEVRLAFMTLLHVIKTPKIRFKWICQQAEHLAEASIFENLGEFSQSIASYLLDDACWNNDTVTGPEINNRGFRFILLLKIEKKGIQTKIESLYSCIDILLDAIPEKDIEVFLREFSFTDFFTEFLEKKKHHLTWSEKKQDIFEAYAEVKKNDTVDVTKRFSIVDKDHIEKSWNIKYHPGGKQNLDEPHGRICTVDWDLISQTITLFVEEKKIELNLTPVQKNSEIGEKVREDIFSYAEISGSKINEHKFNEWIMGSRQGQPGLNKDFTQLACDILMVTETYNLIYSELSKTKNNFERGLELKKRYREWYRGSASSLSAAFAIGVHAENGLHSLEFDDAANALRKQFSFCISKHEKWESYYEEADKDLWKLEFENIIQKALNYLEKDMEKVIEERKSRIGGIVPSTPRITSPQQRAWADNQNSNTKNANKAIKREDCEMIPQIKSALKQMNKGFFFVQDVMKKDIIRNGNLRPLINSQNEMGKENMKGAIVPEVWELCESWLNSIVRYIISKSDNHSTFKEWEYSEHFIEEIELFHFDKYS